MALRTRHAIGGTIAVMPGHPPLRGRESGTRGRFLDHASVDAAVAALAVEQNCVFGLDQLLRLGLSTTALDKRRASGRIHRIHQGVYSLVPAPLLTREGRYMAAVLACGPGAVLSHRSAAALHELRSFGGARIDVTVPVRSSRAHAGVALHRSITLRRTDITEINGIPCTSVARTVLDLAGVVDRRGLERVLDQAEIIGEFDLRALRAQLRRSPTRRGVGKLHSILADHHAGRTPTWSELEERFLRLVRAADIPDPEVNAWIVPADDEPAIRVDFVWRAERVAVEADGHRTHRTRRAFERDRRRDQRLIANGWRPVRVTWLQIANAPDQLTATLYALLGA